ncbi:MAG: serine hydrolase domain-containing protein [Pseudomonadota bacterium]
MTHRQPTRRLACLIITFLALASSYAEERSPASTAEPYAPLVEHLSALVREQNLSGVVLITTDGQPVYEQAFNLDPLRAHYEIRTDTAFTIASITKSFTATLVLDQVSLGRLALDKPISAYLPTFDASYADAVSVRQLLQNRSGIPHYTDIPGWFDPAVKGKFTPESFLAQIASLALKFPPGEDYYYSNANYYLLGLILEAATGERYEALLEERILEPLGLEHTGQIYLAEANTVAPTYLRDGDAYERIQLHNTVLFRATASQYATAADLATFGNALVTGSLLNDEMLDVLLDEDHPMGFTVSATPVADVEVKVITYNGELAGTTTMLTMFPQGTVVILSNNNTPYATLVRLTLDIAELALSGTEP